VGAWPADGYYGDMDGTWTDTTANAPGADDPRNRNIPGDHKFDQSGFYGLNDVELEVGRADMANMTTFPSTGATEQDLMRRYLRKAHAYKNRQAPYDDIPHRSIVRDGFGTYYGEPFAKTGFRTAYQFCGRSDSLIDTPTQLFPGIGDRTYLWGYGDGAGGYTGANTCGTSYDFGTRPSKAVFTSLFGSFLGDWDSANNFMRAPLAGNARGDSYGLVCFWAGRPAWFLHHMALGENIGYSARATMNNSNTFQTSDSGAMQVHIALMGDPTLRLYMPLPPQNLLGSSASGQANLVWDASTDANVLGYLVYRATAPTGAFALLTASRIAATTITDGSGTPGQTYTYMVRTEKLETSTAGTYENSSQGSFVTVTVAPGAATPPNPTGLTAANSGSGPVALAWLDHATNETGYRVERRDGPTAAYAAIGSAPADATGFSDPGPLVPATTYYYRVVAMGAAGDSAPSNEATLFASAGFLNLVNTHMFLAKQDVTGMIPLERYGGTVGAVSVKYATSNGSAQAGVHYTAETGTQTWNDGAEGNLPVGVPLADNGLYSLPRSLHLTASNPTSGSSLTQNKVTTAVIEDTQAVLAWPWQEAPDTLDRAPGVSAEGVIGSTVYGGSFGSGTENVHFMYHAFSGDGSMTVQVPAPVPAQSRSVYGIMVRENLNNWEGFAALRLAGDASGSKFVYRTNKMDWQAPKSDPVANNTDSAPYWLRMTRAGTYFTAETSPDGAAWSTVSYTSVTLPATALWGVFHQADPYGADYQLATFDVKSTPWAAPATPTTTTLTSADVAQGGMVDHAVNFTVTFSEPMNSFAPSKVVVTNGTATGTFVTTTTASAFQFSVNPTTAGLVTVRVPAGAAVGVASPNAVNDHSFPRPNYSFLYAPPLPTTTTLTSPDVAAGGAVNHAVNFIATFSEPMNSFDPSEIVVTNGTASGVFDASTISSSFPFSVNPTTAGLVTVRVPAGAAVGVASPHAVNDYSFPRPAFSFTYDPVGPIVSVGAVAPAVRSAPVASITVHFNEPAADFGVASVVLARNMVPLPLTGVTVTDLGGATDWLVQGLGPLTALAGQYVFTVDPAKVHDALGNPAQAMAWTAWTNAVRYPAQWGVY
jgi:hypothetical protein